MSRSRPYHLKQNKVDDALWLLDYNVRCLQDDYREPQHRRDVDAWRHLQENLRLLAEEPSALRNEDGRLHSAAVYLLQQLNEIHFNSPASFVKRWKILGPRLSRALYEFLFHRDAPHAEVIRKARSTGGVQSVRARAARSEKSRELKNKVREKADEYRKKSTNPRNIASLVARDLSLTPSYVRMILKK